MKIAKVIGTIWSTRKDEKLRSYKLLIVQPLNLVTQAAEQTPFVAADIIGAGIGETVLIVGGRSGGSAGGDMAEPVEGTVVGSVDEEEICRDVLQ